MTIVPAPTGPYSVGATRLFLTNPATDPITGSATRWVTVNAFYPTAATGVYAKFLSDGVSKDNSMAQLNAQGWDGTWNYFWSPNSTQYPKIHAQPVPAISNAAPRTDLGLLPVVVISPGFGVGGAFHTTTAIELASQGFLALVLSVTWESIAAELSSGVAPQQASIANQWQMLLNARLQDTNYLLNQLPTLGGGLGAIADTSRVAAAGHSYGGYTVMQQAFADPRIKAVLCLDAPCGWPGTTSSPQNAGMPLGQPVFLLSSPNGVNGDGHASWTGFKTQAHGPFWIAEVSGTQHTAFTDLALADPNAATFCGTIAPARIADITRRYAADFFDSTLRDGTGGLIQGDNPTYPEVSFLLVPDGS